MEMEAVVQERATLESQLDSLQTQVESLVSEVEEQKLKVTPFFLNTSVLYKFFCLFCTFSMHLLQVASIKESHDQSQSDLNSARSKMKECDAQISRIIKEQQKFQNKISEANIERKKLENEVYCNLQLWQ